MQIDQLNFLNPPKQKALLIALSVLVLGLPELNIYNPSLLTVLLHRSIQQPTLLHFTLLPIPHTPHFTPHTHEPQPFAIQHWCQPYKCSRTQTTTNKTNEETTTRKETKGIIGM